MLKIFNKKDQPKIISLKEVIQPHLPVGLPCYDFTLVINFNLSVLFYKS